MVADGWLPEPHSISGIENTHQIIVLRYYEKIRSNSRRRDIRQQGWLLVRDRRRRQYQKARDAQ
jgi:hypothetical protein